MKRLISLLAGLSLLLTCSISSYAQPYGYEWVWKEFELSDCVLSFNYIPIGPHSWYDARLKCWERSAFSPQPLPQTYDVGTIIFERGGLVKFEGLIGEYELIYKDQNLHLCSSCIILKESNAD
jgi:hypothetical protein